MDMNSGVSLAVMVAPLNAKRHGLFAPRIGGARMTSTKAEPGKGRCILARDSSLRKVMRAARRDMMPSERLQIIGQAVTAAAIRAPLYEHGKARQRGENLDGSPRRETVPAKAKKPRKSRAKGAKPGDVAKPGKPRPHKRKSTEG